MGLTEQALGIRPAPVYEQDSQGYARGMGAIEFKAWKKKKDFDLHHNLISKPQYDADIQAAKDKMLKYGGPEQ